MLFTSGAQSLIQYSEKDQYSFSARHPIFGTAVYSDGFDTTGSSVEVISPLGVLNSYVVHGNTWEVDCGDPGPNWPSGTAFTVYVDGCCGHGGWVGKKSGIVSGDENNMGEIIVYPNTAPNTPSIPIGPKFIKMGTEVNFSTSATDPDFIHQVRYRFDWNSEGNGDLSQYTSYVDSGEFASLSHSWSIPGSYVIRAQAQDEQFDKSNWSEGLTVYVYEYNSAPSDPVITGESTCQRNATSEFYISSIDPEGHVLKYLVDWGDGTNSGWVGPYDSGETITVFHKWENRGNYQLKVKAMDLYEFESGWSNPHDIRITAPEIAIEKSAGGFFSVTTTITNIGDYTATDLHWYINISDTLFFNGIQTQGDKNILEPNESITLKSTPVYGFGLTTLSIEVFSSNSEFIKKELNLAVIFFYIKILD